MNKIRLKRYPTISVLIATFNSHNTINMCLESVRNQEYPQNKIEIILADGGSKDDTLQVGKKFGATVIKVPPKLQNAEYNKGVGLKKTKGELVLMIDHDNVLPTNQWLKEMVYPLLDDPKIVGVETLRYHYEPTYSLLDRYFALFGAGDPVAYYLGKSDRMSYINDKYNLLGRAVSKGTYYKVTFTPKSVSTIGANGFLIRREILMNNARVKPEDFYHIDVNIDLINKGYNTYAFAKNDIIHFTGYNKISRFLMRKKLFMEQFYVQKLENRRYSVYEKGDTIKLLLFILYAATLVKPTIDALRGYSRIKDSAWLFHPILSFALLCIYGYTTIKGYIKSV